MLTFASETVGTISAAQVATLTNTGNAPLSIIGISASGDFAETNTCSTSLVTGSSCQISVTFAPSAAGNRAGSIAIADSAAGSPQTIALSGVGVAAPDFTVGLASGSQASQTVPPGRMRNSVSPSRLRDPSRERSTSVAASRRSAASPPTCSLSSSSLQLSAARSTDSDGYCRNGRSCNRGVSRWLSTGAMPLAWTAMLLGTGGLLPRKRKRWLLMALSAMALVCASAIGCGGGGSSSSSHTTTTPGTSAGTYTVTITAISGSLSHNTTMTVIVQ